MMRHLRALLVLDAAILLLLGLVLVIAPHLAGVAFGFAGLPPGMHFLVSMWGVALATMSIGYVTAAHDPVRHVAWVQMGIARGALECILGVIYLARGLVTFQQAGAGIV